MLFQGDLVYAGCVDINSPCFHETKSLTYEDSLVVSAVLIPNITKHLRRPWTSAFFRLASGTVGFSPRLKNSGHVITF